MNFDFDGFDLAPFPESSNDQDDDLQRTEKWLEDRRGRFTGSRFKDLMTCTRSAAKIPWGEINKLIEFGVTAEKYIYNVGKQRVTGINPTSPDSWQMKHGKEHEPLFIEKLLQDNFIESFEPCAFVKFDEYENAGASPDGKVIYQGREMGFEIKCTVSWDGHFNRMYDDVHDKHDDWWQFQAEMKALNVDELLYVVASPMTIDHYEYKIINASPVHQNAMIERCKIADHAISLWDKYTYKQSLAIACSNYMSYK